ncbi:MAG: glycosyltransferase family 1 protein [Bacteroidales bacterium]
MTDISVLYDHQAFEMQRFGGISRYFYELMTHLEGNVELAIKYYTNDYLKEAGDRFPGIHLPERPYKWFKGPIKRQNRLNSIARLKKSECKIFHPTYHTPYFLDHIGKKRYVLTVHDMNHELLPHTFRNSDAVIAMKRDTILRADRIIAISENTKKDIVDILNVDPAKIDVVYHGVRPLTLPYAGLKLPERYILYVGDRNAYKNFYQLLEAFKVLASKDKTLFLICTGKVLKKAEQALIHQSGLQGRVIHIHANDLELKQLYQQASLFVFPSLYEGFGVPILEAFSYNCPVLLSNRSCFPEIAADSAMYFDPSATESLVESAWQILGDESLRQQMINSGRERVKQFTWEKAAKETELVYKKVL